MVRNLRILAPSTQVEGDEQKRGEGRVGTD